ncbi:MAG: glycosyltransferase [Desulfamplus sp.]|nr:glycosyltransferase [Desulfamplus sp.]
MTQGRHDSSFSPLHIFQTSAALLLILYLAASSAFLKLDYQMLMGASIFLAAYVAVKTVPEHQLGRIFIMAACGFLTIRYWFFRTTVTISFTSGLEFCFSLLLYFAETYGIIIYFMGMFVNSSPMTRVSPKLPSDIDKLPTVDVYIPTYNESADMVKITAIACTQLFYPKEKLNIYILDDGGTRQKLNDQDVAKAAKAKQRADSLKKVAKELSINYATRERNVSAKAGNLNESLMSCECRLDEDAFDKMSCINEGIHQGCGEVILILDCDHVPARDFLQHTVGFFLQDPNLFLLQTPHFFINPDPVEKNLETFRKSPSENEMFYAAIHPGLDFWNASFFCGSAAILRRKFLLEVGGIAGQTITEDAETALGLHARGYNSAYLLKPLIIGLTPETFDDFIVQRSRWAQGMIQIFLLKNPLFQKGLTIFQKICYFNSSFFWFFGIARAVFFISPLVLLFFGLKIYNASLMQVLGFAVPHLAAAYLLSNYLFGRYRHPFFSELYETIQSFYLLPAIISAILKPRSPVFVVTPKAVSLKKDFISHLAAPFYIMLFLAIAAYIAGVYRLLTIPGVFDSIILCMLWNTFNVVMVLSCLGVVWEKRQMRAMHRFATDENVFLDLQDGKSKDGNSKDNESMVSATLFDLSLSGAGIRINSTMLEMGEKKSKTEDMKAAAGEQKEKTEDGKILTAERKDLTGSHIIIHAKDSYGNRYSLPVEVKQHRNKGDHSILGCLFTGTEQADMTDVINFVYGDSSRWKFFSQRGKTAPVGYVSGSLLLIKTGVIGTLTNFRGVWSIVMENMKIYVLHISGR